MADISSRPVLIDFLLTCRIAAPCPNAITLVPEGDFLVRYASRSEVMLNPGGGVVPIIADNAAMSRSSVAIVISPLVVE